MGGTTNEARPIDSSSVSISGVRKAFRRRRFFFGKPEVLWAIDGQRSGGVSLEIGDGEILALVGESGSGKSTLARVILGLVPADSGHVRVGGEEVTGASRRELFQLRARMQMVFQDPFSSLNPRRSVRSTLAQPLLLHRVATRRTVRARVDELLQLVGLTPAPVYAERYPHQLSGGQRQRVAIARAIACNPRLIVADEPVASLDVSVRATILNLLREMRDELGLSVLLITHDLGVVRAIADRVAVMYLGRIVECGDVESIISDPQHPYTQALLASAPIADPRVARSRQRRVVAGEIPSPTDPPSGCTFHTRCPLAIDLCSRLEPELMPTPTGLAACHLLQSNALPTEQESWP